MHNELDSSTGSLPSSLQAHTQPSRADGQALPHSSNFQSFGQYSAFLRSAVADEESLQMGENLQELAVQVEALMAMLKPSDAPVAASTVAQAFFHLLDGLRGHRAMLLSLSADWHRFYEFDAHFSTLNQFRILVTRWAKETALPDPMGPSPTDFDLAAWRVLGAGAMLLDVYEQTRATVVPQGAQPASVSVWGRWGAWWRRRVAPPPEPQPEQRKAGRRGRRQSD